MAHGVYRFVSVRKTLTVEAKSLRLATARESGSTGQWYSLPYPSNVRNLPRFAQNLRWVVSLETMECLAEEGVQPGL
jgi:hypothetical protein